MAKPVAVIPTYNEKENIVPLIETLFTRYPALKVLIVDGASPDKTSESVRTLKYEKYHDRLHLISQTRKEGLAKAYVTGFRWCLERDFDTIIQMDADFSHDPKYIEMFLNDIETYDIVIGSRYIKGGGTDKWPFFRKLLSYGGNWYARKWLGMKTHDVTGGFRCFRRSALQQTGLERIMTTGYAFQIETLYNAALNQCTVKEIPIIFYERKNGKSKLSKSILFEALMKVPLLQYRKRS